jgi:hypothetical protein
MLRLPIGSRSRHRTRVAGPSYAYRNNKRTWVRFYVRGSGLGAARVQLWLCVGAGPNSVYVENNWTFAGPNQRAD